MSNYYDDDDLNSAIAYCEEYRDEYIRKEVFWNGRCGECECNGEECTLQCWDECESCSSNRNGCAIYSETNIFDENGLLGDEICMQVTSGRHAGPSSLLCSKDKIEDRYSSKTECSYSYRLAGQSCSCKICGNDYDEVIDCTRVDGESYSDDCKDESEGVWDLYEGSLWDEEESYTGRCTFDKDSFFNDVGTPAGAGAGANISSNENKKIEPVAIAGVVIGIVVGGLGCYLVFLFFRQHHRANSAPSLPPKSTEMVLPSTPQPIAVDPLSVKTVDGAIGEIVPSSPPVGVSTPKIDKSIKTTISGNTKTTVTTTADSKTTVTEVTKDDGTRVSTETFEKL